MTREDDTSEPGFDRNAVLLRLRNFGLLSAEDICRIVIGFLVTLALAKYLGPSQFGALGYLTSIVALLMPFTVFGLDVIVLRQFVAHPASMGSVLASSMAIRLFGSVVAVALALAFFDIAGGPAGTSLYLMAIASISLIAMPWQSLNLYFKAEERPVIFALPRIVIVIAAAVAILILIDRGYGLESIIWLRVFETAAMALAAIIAFVLFARHRISITVDTVQLHTLLRQGFPLFISAIAVIIYMRVDQIMLGTTAPVAELGNYSLAVRFSEAAFFIPMALQTAFYPALVRARKVGNEHFRSELRRYFDAVSGVMMALVLAVGVASHAIILLALGDEYRGAIPAVWILSAALPFVGIGVARSSYLTIEGKFWAAPIATLIGAAMNVALNFLLIPQYGGTGAAIASLISYWLAAHGTCYLLPQLRSIAPDIARSLNPIGVMMRVVPPMVALVTDKRP